MRKLKMHSPNFAQENVAKLADLFPGCVTESIDRDGILQKAIDFDLLRQELSTAIVEGPQERYHLNWPGKREALLTANDPITKTLRPSREESVEFDTTGNLFIEGDNLDALKLLQETYLGKVKMIYIDPPYNTGKDFIYADNFAQSTEKYQLDSGQRDEKGNRLVANTDSNGRFHSDWLSMMYPRLKLARNLLKDDGVIFISIDDNEQANLKNMCDEIYVEENFIGSFVINSTPDGKDYGHIAKNHAFCVFYCKNLAEYETNLLLDETKKFKYNDAVSWFNIIPLYNSNETFHKNNRPNLYYPFYIYPTKRVLEFSDGFYEIGLEKTDDSIEIYPPLSRKNKVQFVWRWGREKSAQNLNKEIIGYKIDSREYRIVQKSRTMKKLIRSIIAGKEYTSRRGTAEVENLLSGKVFNFPKPIELVKRFLMAGMNKNSLAIDFFAGSATTAHAVMQLNAEDGGKRKFIMVQLPELCDDKSEAFKAGYKTIAEISKERIRRAGKKIKKELTTKDSKGTKEKDRNLFSKADKEIFCEVPAFRGSKDLDIGFRVLKIDSSNMADVYYTPDKIEQGDLLSCIENIKDDRTSEDLLFQVLLDWGVDLTLPITRETIGGCEVFFVDENALAACFEKAGLITEDFCKELAGRGPLRVVFRDAGFKDDSVRINVEQIFKLMSPDTDVKII